MIVNNIDPIGVDVSTSPPPEVEHSKCSAAAAELFSERQHVLSGTPEPIQGGDQQRVPILQGPNCPVELWAGRPGAGHTMVEVHIIPTHRGRQEIGFLTIRGLLPGRHSRVTDQRRQGTPPVS